MIEINGYEVYPQEEISTPIHMYYRGHHKLINPSIACRIEAVFDEDVPQCYQKFAQKGNYYFVEPTILLRQIFTTPQHPNQIFFVERWPTESQDYLDLDLQRRILCAFQVLQIVCIIRNLQLVHDFSLQNIAIGKEQTFFYNFVKDGGEDMDGAKMETQVNHLISQLVQGLSAGTFSVNLRERTCLKWSKTIGDIQFRIRYEFMPEKIVIIGLELKDGEVEDEWKKIQIPYNQMKNNLPLAQKMCNPTTDKQTVNISRRLNQAGSSDVITVKDSNQGFPYNSVGTIIAKLKNDKGKYLMKENGQPSTKFGTAALISEYIIITCAHTLLIKQKNGKIYSSEAQDIVFQLNGISYEIEKIQLHRKYKDNLQSDNQYKYDFALLKLKEKIPMKLYIEIVQNYKQTEMELKVKGFHSEKSRIRSTISSSSKLQFDEKNKGITMQYSIDQKDYSGFSGSPIFVILAELDFDFKYHFIIGIHNSGAQSSKGRMGMATYFDEEIIKQLAQLEQKLIKGGKIFKSVFNFKNITNNNLQQACGKIKGKLNEIVFNAYQRQYIPKIFQKVTMNKPTDRNHIQKVFADTLMLVTQHDKKNEILIDLDSFNYDKRHNNLMFAYHATKFSQWFIPWQAFGESEGLIVFFIYLVIKLQYFFSHAKVSKEKKQKYAQFQQFLRLQVHNSYTIRTYCLAAAGFIIFRIDQLQMWLKQIPMNHNFRKILLIEVQFIKIFSQLQVKSKTGAPQAKLFQVSKLFTIAFLAKEFITKVAEISRQINTSLHIINQLLVISMKILMAQELLEAKEAKFSFAWSVRALIKDYPSIKQDFLRLDPNHKEFLGVEELKQRKMIEEYVEENYIGPQVKQFLRNCFHMYIQ